MPLNSIILLFFLSCKITAGSLIQHNAGYQSNGGDYYGAGARISAWGVPDMNSNSNFEVSVILLNYNGDRVSLIKAGFHVLPSLYGNNDLRMFTDWNGDARNLPPCYNLHCDGFVVANRSIFYPGQAVHPLSQYNGTDYSIAIIIKKDPTTGFWTLYREFPDTSLIKLGWWRNISVGNLNDKANSVQWSGFVQYNDNDTGPAMGSGHFPKEGYTKAAYMSELKLYTENDGDTFTEPFIADLLKSVDKPKCYDVHPAPVDLHRFYYGGPAGCRG